MARTRDRVIALILAIVFFATSVGVSGLVVWQAMQDNNGDTTMDTSQNQPMLQGTKLEGFEPVAEVEKLQVIDLTPGQGQEVKSGDTVAVDYTGAVASTGIIFQSSLDTGEPVTISLDNVIEGWKQGLAGMKEGGKRRLIIPANLAYGDSAPQGSGISPGDNLVFDVTLQGVVGQEQ